jgi:hypothetical protein
MILFVRPHKFRSYIGHVSATSTRGSSLSVAIYTCASNVPGPTPMEQANKLASKTVGGGDDGGQASYHHLNLQGRRRARRRSCIMPSRRYSPPPVIYQFLSLSLAGYTYLHGY